MQISQFINIVKKKTKKKKKTAKYDKTIHSFRQSLTSELLSCSIVRCSVNPQPGIKDHKSDAQTTYMTPQNGIEPLNS